MAKSSASSSKNTEISIEEKAELKQQFYYEHLGDRDWDRYNYDEHMFLKRNIGFALYGDQVDRSHFNEVLIDEMTGYTKLQNKQINEIYNAIMRHHYLEDTSIILVRIIFICCVQQNEKYFEEPVFVLKMCHITQNYPFVKNCMIFIDSNARVYKSWQSYLKNNQLPKCLMIAPKNGRYCGKIINVENEEVRVIIEKVESPACSLGQKILTGADVVSTVTAFGSVAAGVAVAIPSITVAPVVLTGVAISSTAVGLYSVGRSTFTLFNRKKHDQSISLDNAESRWCWLNTAVGVFGATTSAAASAMSKAASKGIEVSKTAKLAFNVVNGANVVGSFANMGLSSYQIIEKFINHERPSKFEVFQLASSILFFHSSVVNFRTANTIILETQQNTLSNYENSLRSNRHRKLFKKAKLETCRVKGEISGNSELIKGISKINDPDNFFANLAKINKDLNKNNVRFTISADGQVKLNDNFIIDPHEFVQLSKNARGDLLKTVPARPETSKLMSKSTFDTKFTAVRKFIENNSQFTEIMLKIGISAADAKIDMNTFTFLLGKFENYVVELLIKFLLNVLKEVKDCLNDFMKVYPLVSLPVGVLQWLINYFETNASVFCTDLISVIKRSCANLVGKEFLKWLKEKIELLKTSNKTLVIDLRVKRKEKVKCELCYGYYFKTI